MLPSEVGSGNGFPLSEACGRAVKLPLQKPEHIKQEIYGRLTIYNLGIFIANEAANENRKKQRKEDNKFRYEVDFSRAIRTALKYFRKQWDMELSSIIKVVCRYIHAVKDKFRSFPRPFRGIGAIHFNYR